MEYLIVRVDLVLRIVLYIDIVPRTVEIAKLYGCEYESVVCYALF